MEEHAEKEQEEKEPESLALKKKSIRRLKFHNKESEKTSSPEKN